MREPTIIPSTHDHGAEVTHVQDLSTGQIWRADNRKRRGKGPFVPGHIPPTSANAIVNGRYFLRPPGKR